MGILLTLGAVGVFTTQQIVRGDANGVVTATALGAATAVSGDIVAAPSAGAPDAQAAAFRLALSIAKSALPTAMMYEVVTVSGDSMRVVAADRGAGYDEMAGARDRTGESLAVPPGWANEWSVGQPGTLIAGDVGLWHSGFTAGAPIRTADGRVVAAVIVTAAPTPVIRWDDDLGDAVLAGLAVSLLLAALTGIAVYRVENARAESRSQLIASMEAAEATARARGEFLANMSHEIRTPLHGVLGMTEALLATEHTEADRRSLQVINRSASSLLGILNDILDYTKLEAGRVELVDAPFEPRALVDDVTDLFAVRAEEKGIDLTVRESARADHWPVGDAARIRQVLLNLVGNAVKFTDKGSVEIDLSTVTIGRKTIAVRIAVRDTGIGIDPEAQERVFEQFSQADSSTSRRFGGTGLGLTISRQLVLLMGGTISVASVPGEGSEFVVSFQFPAAPAAAESPPIPPFAPGERVLICTPLKATMASLTELCTRDRLVVESATSLAQAQRRLDSDDRFVAIICDMKISHDTPHPLSKYRPALVILTTVHEPLNNSVLSAYGAATQLRRPVRQDHFTAMLGDLATGRRPTPRASAIARGDPRPASLPSVGSAPVSPPAARSPGAGPSGSPVQGAAAPASGARVEGFASKTSTSGGPRVMVVDDVDLNLIVAKAMLTSLGADVRTAPGGEEALALLAKDPVDLVFMDCHMPGLDGYDVTKCVRSTPGPNRDVPIVALSASAFAEDKERALTSGMNDFATKPIELESLRAVMNRWAPMPATDTEESA